MSPPRQPCWHSRGACAPTSRLSTYTQADQTVGPFLAPGRVVDPNIGITVRGNFVQSVDSACGTDAMRFANIHDNFVFACGSPFSLGYNKQEYVKIHDNIFYNSCDSESHTAGMTFANNTPRKCEVYNNLVIDDRSVPAPSALRIRSGSDPTTRPSYVVGDQGVVRAVQVGEADVQVGVVRCRQRVDVVVADDL